MYMIWASVYIGHISISPLTRLTHSLTPFKLHAFFDWIKKKRTTNDDGLLSYEEKKQQHAVCWSSDEGKQQHTYKSNIHHGYGRQTAWLSMFFLLSLWIFYFHFHSCGHRFSRNKKKTLSWPWKTRPNAGQKLAAWKFTNFI